MAEVLAEFPDVVVADGVRYHVHACGAPLADGRWQGWLEFVPFDGSEPIRSPRETTQPNRTDAVYWATGLTPVYFEGALSRALHPTVTRHVDVDGPVFAEPAPPLHAAVPATGAAQPEAVLDPFAVCDQEGEAFLRRRLAALAAWHLVNIVQHYELSDEPAEVLSRLTAPALIERIVAAANAKTRARGDSSR